MEEEKRSTDWEAIEREYRSGQLSVSAIGRLHGVSHTAIQKRAKRDKWTRNLAERVREEVAARLVAEGVSAKSATETVTLAAERDIQLILQDRADICAAGKIVRDLFDELGEVAEKRDEIEKTIEIGTKDDKNVKRRTTMLKAVSLPSRAATALNLCTALKSLVGLKRQAFNLGQGPSEEDPAPAITPSQRRSAIALILARQDPPK